GVQRRDRRAGRPAAASRHEPREDCMSAARDPVRLVADASITDAERTLLRHGVDLAPPDDAEARVWQGLAGALGVAAVVSAAEASAKTAANTATTAAATGTKAVAAGVG